MFCIIRIGEESTSKQVNIETRARSSFTCLVKCRLLKWRRVPLSHTIFSSSSTCHLQVIHFVADRLFGLSFFSHRIFATFACEWTINHVQNSNELITFNPRYTTFDLNLCKSCRIISFIISNILRVAWILC